MLANVRFLRFPALTVPKLCLFPSRLASYFANRPLTLTSGSSVLFRLFFRVPSPSRQPSSFDSSFPAQGFGPLRDSTCVRPQFARFPSPSLRSALRFSQPFGGFLRTLALRAYFIPQPRSGFLFPFRVFLPSYSRTFSSKAFCPLVDSPRASFNHSLKLSTLRLCSVRGSVPQVWCYPPLWPFPLRGFVAPSGLASSTVTPAYPVSNAYDFFGSSLQAG